MGAVVKIVRTSEKAKIPVYQKYGDAGADVFTIEGGVIPAGETRAFDLGLRIQLPYGWEMQVRSRSGLAKKGIVVANSPGTIDSGYRGPCMVLLHNNGHNTYIVHEGDRVAQFVLKRAPVAEYQEVPSLDDSERAEGGFGSTGS